jgi:hypothetical protein
VTLVHSTRFVEPPETITDLTRNDRRWHLVRGEILAMIPSGAPTLELPLALPSASAVLARIDVEELQPLARPLLATHERGRDFFIADARGGSDAGDGGAAVALVRICDDAGRLHPEVELHLGAPFSEHPLPSAAPTRRTAFLRTLSAGQSVYVLGRARLESHPQVAGLRAAPLIPTFAAGNGPLHLYDQSAFEQLAAWCALPWYRKLSVLVRNR